ncbi:MAG: PEP-CTERM-box response regulator transcription factor [Pseudomonadales bacterium]
MTDRRLLIIEDDPGLQKQMRWCFDDLEVYVAGNAEEAEAVARREEPGVITLDLGLPPDPGGTSQGLLCLDMIGSLLPRSKVIVITGREERETAMEAIAHGAYDFYQKPIDSDALRFVVDRAFKIRELEEANRRLNSAASRQSALDGLITDDDTMLSVCRQVEKVASAELTVSIQGETGTGKEVIAKNIHRLSDRAEGPFVAINCAAIPENLLESELFGHEKGAFTGAVGRKIGRIEAANGGTLFLDEIGDMPLPLQSKILRFLQERTFERLGGHASIAVDVRVVSATHHDLNAMISEGTFREDLFYRLTEITLMLPPLRDRGEDVILLARFLLQRVSEAPIRLSSEAEQALRSHAWPGNIRELENRIKRAAILCENQMIHPADLELEGPDLQQELPLNLKAVRAAAESQAIVQALGRAAGNLSRAARLLGVSRPTLYNLLQKYGLEVDKEA